MLLIMIHGIPALYHLTGKQAGGSFIPFQKHGHHRPYCITQVCISQILVTVIKYLIKYGKKAFFGLLISEGFWSVIAGGDMVKKFDGSGNI